MDRDDKNPKNDHVGIDDRGVQVRAISDDASSPERGWTLLVLALVAVTTALLPFTSATGMNSPWDVVSFLDGAWRVLQGQVPHVDFYSPLGPVSLLVFALGMHIAGPSLAAITCGTILFFLVVTFWTWAVCRPRMSPGWSALLALHVGWIAAGTHMLAYPSVYFGYAGLYNRYGYALCALPLIDAFARLRDPANRHAAWWGGLSTGVALALLAFLKVNFFAVGATTVLLGALLFRQSRQRWLGLAIGSGVTTLALLAYLRFDIAAIGRDLTMAILARSSTLAAPDVLRPSFAWMGVLAACWCIVPFGRRSIRSGMRPRLAMGLIILFVLAAQAVLDRTNSQGTVLPPILLGIGAVLVLSQAPDPADTRAARRLWLGRLLALSLIAAVLVPNVLSIGFAVHFRFVRMPHESLALKIDSPRLESFMPQEPWAELYVNKVNNGLALLRQHTSPTSRLFVIDHSNPFSFALARPSATGGALWWHEGVSFNVNHYPDAERAFGNADVVLVGRAQPLSPSPWRLYRDTLATKFHMAAQSQYWILFLKTPTPG